MSLRHDRGRDRDRAGGEVLPVPRSLDVHEVVQRREDGVFVEGFACFTHKSVVATVTNLHLEHWNELNPEMYLKDPAQGWCCFVPKEIHGNINDEVFMLSMTDSALYVTARHAAKFAVESRSNDSLLWSGKKKRRSPSPDGLSETMQHPLADSIHVDESCEYSESDVCDTSSDDEEPPSLDCAEVANVAVPHVSHEDNQPSRSKLKTPKASTVTLQTNISAKDKVEVQSTAATALDVDWAAPIPSDKVLDSNCMEVDEVVNCIHDLRHSGRWSLKYGTKPYLPPVEDQVFVVPEGRYNSKRNIGFENIEYFTERRHLVTHIQRNPVLTYDFFGVNSIWNMLEKQGWRKLDRSKSDSHCLFSFPAANCVIPSLMQYNTDRTKVTNIKGVHDFHSRSALHLYIMRFPYPLQEDDVLIDTILSMGWTAHSRHKRTFCHPLLNCGNIGATVDQVRQLLWTDPTLLVADAYNCNNDMIVSSALRAAFQVPDDCNVIDPDEKDFDCDDTYVRKILSIVEKHVGQKSERFIKNGGVWWKFTKKETQKIENILVKHCGWSIENSVPGVTEWWKHFKAYLPNFDDTLTRSNSPKKGGKKYIPGISIFWTLDDAVNYIRRYGNVPPMDIGRVPIEMRVNYAEMKEADYKSILSSETFDLKIDFLPIFKTLLDDKWSVTKVKPLDMRQLYPAAGLDGEVDAVFVPSWIHGSSLDDGTLDTSELVLDKDYFVFQECLINYLKRFGNTRKKPSDFNKMTDNGNKINNNGTNMKEFHFISDSANFGELVSFSGKTTEIKIMNEIRYLLSEASGKYVTSDILVLLEGIGWKKNWQSKLKIAHNGFVIFPPWVDSGTSCVTDLTINVDYFLAQDDVISFLKLHGFKRPTRSAEKVGTKRIRVPSATSAAVMSNSNNNIADDKLAEKSAPLKKGVTNVTKLKKGVIKAKAISPPSVTNRDPPSYNDNEAELHRILSSPGKYKSDRVFKELDKLGWMKNVKSNFAMYRADYIILPPWGREHYDFDSDGKESTIQMIPNIHYFLELRDVVRYLKTYGNKASESAVKAAKTEGRRRRSQMVRVCSMETEDKSSKKTKNETPTKDVDDGSASDEYGSEQDSDDCDETEEESDDGEIGVEITDPYPGLSNTGREGDMKRELIDNPKKYPSEIMRPYMEEWGWDFQVKCDSALYFKDYIILAPWAVANFAKDELGKNSIHALLQNADYFHEMSDARDYVLAHGNNELSADMKEAMTSSNCRSKRRRSSAHAASTETLNKTEKTKPNKEKKNNKKKSDKSSGGSFTRKERQSNAKSNAAEVDQIEEEEEFSYTQTVQHYEAFKSDEPLPEIDHDCSTEIRAIVWAICKDRPRLNPTKFSSVYSVLKAYDWSYFYTSKLGYEEVYHRPRLQIKASNMTTFKEGVDYFLSKDAVLEFVKEQIIARNRNYQALADKALFFREEDMANDDADILEPVTDEDHFSLKLPVSSLYQSANPYERQFDALTSHNQLDDNEDEMYDDIPIGSFDDESYLNDNQGDVGDQLDTCNNLFESTEVEEETAKYSDMLETGQELSDTVYSSESQTQAQLEDYITASSHPENSESDLDNADCNVNSRKRKVNSSPEAASIQKRLTPKRKCKSIVPGESISHSKAKPASVSHGTSPKHCRINGENSTNQQIVDLPNLKRARVSPKSANTPPTQTSSPHDAIDHTNAENILQDDNSSTSLGEVIARVRSRLQASYTPSAVLHREAEYEEIYVAVRESLLSGVGTTIRVAGQPGQGKTLTVKKVIAEMEADTELGNFTSCYLKGSNFSGGFRYLAKELGYEGMSEEQSQITLTKEFSGASNKSEEMLLLVIDEIDMAPNSFRQSLLNIVKLNYSRVVLIGLSNEPPKEDFDTDVVFEVYTESQIHNILKSLTENLFEERGAQMITKTCTAVGDIRPMTTLALTCLDILESKLSSGEEESLGLMKPATSVVNVGIVMKAKSQTGQLNVREKLESISKCAMIALVAVCLQYSVGFCFTFSEMADLVNTRLTELQMSRLDGDEIEARQQELLNSSFMIENSPKNKSIRNKRFSLTVNASDLLQDNCKNILMTQNWKSLEEIARLRKEKE